MPTDNALARLEVLSRLLLAPDDDVLRRIDFNNLDLGTYLRQYASPPEPVDLGLRSTIREDVVVRELARLLSEHQDATIRVLDACCGVAGLARRVLRSMEQDLARIAYYAVDRDTGCVETVRSQEPDFTAARVKHFETPGIRIY